MENLHLEVYFCNDIQFLNPLSHLYIGGGSETVTKSVARKTKDIDEKVISLRSAIFLPNGKDKDVTASIAPAFLNYNRNSLNIQISFAAKLSEEQLDWAFEMAKNNMEERYDLSGYGWDDEDKERELTEPGTRFLLIRDLYNDKSENDQLIGFVHFRFTVEGMLALRTSYF